MDTWANSQKHYFPAEYSAIWSYLNKHIETHGALPSFEDLDLAIRDASLRDRFSAISKVEDVDIEGELLLEYLKNEYAQVEIMNQLENYLTDSIAMETAQENIESLQNIVLDMEEKIELQDISIDMGRMELFKPEEELAKNITLGLNHDYDRVQPFAPSEVVLIGGRRGAGKSITCANIASDVFDRGSSVIYFTMEMTARDIMQRCCSISTGVSNNAIRNRNLSIGEWQTVAEWWSTRFEEGERAFRRYLDHRNFDKYHLDLTSRPLREKQLDIVYYPDCTLANIRTELDKKVAKLQPRVVVIDYINEVKSSAMLGNRVSQYDWMEQKIVSKALKKFAQDYGIVIVSPYQIDATGEARFSKSILDACDVAFTLDAHTKEDNIITFNCSKMRNDAEVDFTSVMNWDSLRIGPETGILKTDEEASEEVYDI